ncbi:MAG: Uma2 family endonuclease [Synechococcales cyanobacterium RM1_1_8]|nr:Uma2 family endonuclease [Synechococcales cyanobacterium RM1_1_8]
MVASSAKPAQQSDPKFGNKPAIPPLENGDRLSRAEFERRYEAMPHLKKAELIEGVVYMAAATRAQQHGNPHALVIGWLATYHAMTPGTYLADNTTVLLDGDNEPQPDALLRWEDGSSRITGNDYIEGPPELVVEIAASSVSYDKNDKLKAYRRNGVQEYVIWQIYEDEIVWYQLVDGQYVALVPNEAGLLESQIFPGLKLDVEAMKNRDLATVLAQLKR